jgi:hypothetical protein
MRTKYGSSFAFFHIKVSLKIYLMQININFAADMNEVTNKYNVKWLTLSPSNSRNLICSSQRLS